MTVWRDINTGPTDGSLVLVCNATAIWVSAWHEKIISHNGRQLRSECGWGEYPYRLFGYMKSVDPTHWTDLPDFPDTAAKMQKTVSVGRW